MYLKILALSIAFFIFAIPFNLNAAQCSRMEDSQGILDGWLLVDGKVNKLLTEEESRLVASKLLECDLNLKEIALLRQEIDILNRSLVNRDLIIEVLQKDRAIDKELLATNLEADKWYEKSSVIFFASFVTTSLLFGYWSYTNKTD